LNKTPLQTPRGRPDNSHSPAQILSSSTTTAINPGVDTTSNTSIVSTSTHLIANNNNNNNNNNTNINLNLPTTATATISTINEDDNNSARGRSGSVQSRGTSITAAPKQLTPEQIELYMKIKRFRQVYTENI
jgi:hypothetical protein